MAKPDNNGSWLISAMMISWVWSVLLYFVRVWAKLSVKRWGSEDYTVTTALVSSRRARCCGRKRQICVDSWRQRWILEWHTGQFEEAMVCQ